MKYCPPYIKVILTMESNELTMLGVEDTTAILGLKEGENYFSVVDKDLFEESQDLIASKFKVTGSPESFEDLLDLCELQVIHKSP